MDSILQRVISHHYPNFFPSQRMNHFRSGVRKKKINFLNNGNFILLYWIVYVQLKKEHLKEIFYLATPTCRYSLLMEGKFSNHCYIATLTTRKIISVEQIFSLTLMHEWDAESFDFNYMGIFTLSHGIKFPIMWFFKLNTRGEISFDSNRIDRVKMIWIRRTVFHQSKMWTHTGVSNSFPKF